MKLKRTEAEVQRAILEYLKTRGDVVAWRANSRTVVMPGKGGRMRPVFFGFPGQPDIIGFMYWSGRFLAIEVKAPGKENNLTNDQRAFLELVREGGIAIVASSVEDVVRGLG